MLGRPHRSHAKAAHEIALKNFFNDGNLVILAPANSQSMILSVRPKPAY